MEHKWNINRTRHDTIVNGQRNRFSIAVRHGGRPRGGGGSPRCSPNPPVVATADRMGSHRCSPTPLLLLIRLLRLLLLRLLLLLLPLLLLRLLLLHGNVSQRLPRGQTQFKAFPTSTLDRDMVVKEFYGEKIVDKHCHKDEQVYWDKFSSIHNKWFKLSGLVPQAVENYAS